MFWLAPFQSVYNITLQPLAPFTWFGLSLSTLDIIATFRLCLVLRQVRELQWNAHVAQHGPKAKREPRSFAKDAFNTLLVVYGGEAAMGPWLGITPSFMISGTVPILYILAQAIVEYMPEVPSMSFETELPLAIVDGFTRSFLLCTLVPPTVTQNASALISTSPWALLLSSLLTNSGFFMINTLSALSPGNFALTTPTELQPYGWATTDLWCAPAITGLYAFLTHAQPFWADLHGVLATLLGGGVVESGEKGPLGMVLQPVMTPEEARSFCAAILATMFTTRAVKNFRPELLPTRWRPVRQVEGGEKEKTQ